MNDSAKHEFMHSSKALRSGKHESPYRNTDAQYARGKMKSSFANIANITVNAHTFDILIAAITVDQLPNPVLGICKNVYHFHLACYLSKSVCPFNSVQHEAC